MAASDRAQGLLQCSEELPVGEGMSEVGRDTMGEFRGASIRRSLRVKGRWLDPTALLASHDPTQASVISL